MSTPVIPGFYPDPSVCRVGNRYYLATSSFEYLPGVPIFESSDLVEWRQIANALDRTDQVAPSPGGAMSGIYAPTIRHHDGRFWLVTTDISQMMRGHLIVSAADPAGPWTDPVFTTGTTGIDPDLSWDEDGICHLTWASDERGIETATVDPATGKLLGKTRSLWRGTGLAHPEGPHLYRIDGWWYLMLAEGGTERGHVVTIARARTLDDDFEPCPTNPILSHRSTSSSVQNTGHADLVQCADGSWAMVYLAVRPRGVTPQFHVNGRETFLAGVDWNDGWPVVLEEHFHIPETPTAFVDSFDDEHLDERWVSPGTFPEIWTRYSNPGRLLETHPDERRMLAFRARDETWTAHAVLDVSAGTASFQVRIDDAHWYALTADSERIQAVLRIGPAHCVVGETPTPASGRVTLRISARDAGLSPHGHPLNEPDRLELAAVGEEGETISFGEFDGRYLSTEVAGGFSGRVIGVLPLKGVVGLSNVSYTPAHTFRHPTPTASVVSTP